MSNWKTVGGLDDAIIGDGDGSFVGMNLRDPLDQLRPGYLGLSQNGRIDGGWEARRGIELKSGVLGGSGFPLRLPFLLLDVGEPIDFAYRSSNITYLEIPSISTLLVEGDQFYLTLGVPGSGIDPLVDGPAAGSYLMTVVDNFGLALSFDDVGPDDTFPVHPTDGIVSTAVYDDAVDRVWGSCVYSNPNSNNAESIILATSNSAKSVLLSDYSTSTIPYPTGTLISARCELLQAFDRVFLFRDGLRPLEYVPNGKPVVSSSYVSSTGVVSMQVKNHGLTVGDSITVSDVGYSLTPTVANPNGVRTVATVVDADNFTFVIATGAGDETYTANTGKVVAAGFTKVAGGPYTQPQTFEIAGNNYGVINGLVRVTVPSNSTIKAGDFVTVYDTDVDFLVALKGKSYQVVTANSTDIYFYAPVGNVTYGSGSGSQFIQIGGRFSVGGGFMHMPAPPWATYFQRRFWVPYFYDNGGTTASPTYTDRRERDQIAASDILDSDTYDQIQSQFRITAGIADYLVGMYPFYNDYLMVMNRNSLHVVKGTQGSLSDTEVHELTREVGCLARKTIAGQGNKVFFLADNGVYGLEFVDEYNLRGFQEPLSKDIQPLIDRINRSLAGDSVGIYFNNRYYLAVPLDSQPGLNDAVGNNSVLIFNMLNGAWESIDTFNSPNFVIQDLLIASAERTNQLYMVSDFGGIHLADSREDATDVCALDAVGGNEVVPVSYQAKTRGYNIGNLERKKFHRGQVQLQSNSDNETDVVFDFGTEDPDSSESVSDVSTELDGSNLARGEMATFRFRLGNPRGIYGFLTVKAKEVGSSPIGRPKVSSVKVEASITNRQTISHQ